MRALLLLLGALTLGGLGGCSGRQYLFVTLDSAAPLTFVAADVTVENGGRTGTARYDRGASIPPSATAVLTFDEDHTGEARITFIARDAAGKELARGSSTVVLTPHQRTDVFITLGKAIEPVVDGGVGDGGGGGGGDMAVADMAVGDMAMPDLLPAPDMTPVLGFAPVSSVPVGPGEPYYLWFEDADKDGLVDIHTTVYLNQVTQLATLRGVKGGGYRLPLFESTGFSSMTAMADLNGDRLLDFIAASRTSADGSAKLARGDGTFDRGTFLSLVGKSYGIVPADYNRDGKKDLAMISAGNIRYLGGNGDGTFRGPIDSTPMYTPALPQAGDINEDGALDFVSLSDGGGQINTLLGAVNGTFRQGTAVVLPSIGIPLLGDFNRDGHLDLLVSRYGVDTFGLFPGVGNGGFMAAKKSGGALSWSLVAADLDEDGKLDVVGVDSKLQNIVATRGNGDGTFGAQLIVAGLPAMHDDVVVADVDGDGDLDVALTATPNAQGVVAIFLNTLRQAP